MVQKWEHHSVESEEEHTSKNKIPQNSEEKFRKVFTFPAMHKKAWLVRQRSRKSQEGKIGRAR